MGKLMIISSKYSGHEKVKEKVKRARSHLRQLCELAEFNGGELACPLSGNLHNEFYLRISGLGFRQSP